MNIDRIKGVAYYLSLLAMAVVVSFATRYAMPEHARTQPDNPGSTETIPTVPDGPIKMEISSRTTDEGKTEILLTSSVSRMPMPIRAGARLHVYSSIPGESRFSIGEDGKTLIRSEYADRKSFDDPRDELRAEAGKSAKMFYLHAFELPKGRYDVVATLVDLDKEASPDFYAVRPLPEDRHEALQMIATPIRVE